MTWDDSVFQQNQQWISMASYLFWRNMCRIFVQHVRQIPALDGGVFKIMWLYNTIVKYSKVYDSLYKRWHIFFQIELSSDLARNRTEFHPFFFNPKSRRRSVSSRRSLHPWDHGPHHPHGTPGDFRVEGWQLKMTLRWTTRDRLEIPTPPPPFFHK